MAGGQRERIKPQRLGFEDWALQVDALCRIHLACSWNDLCGDMAPLRRGFATGDTPRDFVEWWRDKYDLNWYDGLWRV